MSTEKPSSLASAWVACLSLALALLMAAFVQPLRAQEAATAATEPTAWQRVDEAGNLRLQVHFFWALGCPYCKKEEAFFQTLLPQYSWLEIVDHEISEHPENVRLMLRMAKEAGGSTSLVPTTFICNQMTVGFQKAETTGDLLHRQALDCYKRVLAGGSAVVGGPGEIAKMDLPLLGTFDPNTLSLPVLTMAVATVDAFNPCGLFILLMLMSMMVRAHSRVHMVVIGASFGLTWATIYLLLMTAWLSLFEYVGDIRLITSVAGAVVLVMATINFKDFLGYKIGPTLSMSDTAKAGLFTRMGALVRYATQPPAAVASADPATGSSALLRRVRTYGPLVLGTVLLTLSASGYALLCTTGFAMTYTRVLTLHGLPLPSYLGYLVFYVVIYMIPMALIIVAFTLTLGARKLRESEGRALKLLAALMLGGLGVMLLGAPDLVKNPLVVITLMMLAFVVTVIVVNAERMLRQRPRPAAGSG